MIGFYEDVLFSLRKSAHARPTYNLTLWFKISFRFTITFQKLIEAFSVSPLRAKLADPNIDYQVEPSLRRTKMN